jgi:hypothetical protein
LRGRPPARRRIVVGRRAQELRRGDDDHEICGTKQHERGLDAVCLDQLGRERAGDESAEPEPGHRKPGDEAALVGKPLDQHGERNDVAETETDPTEDAVAQVQDGKIGSEAGQNDAAPVEHPGNGCRRARTDPPLQAATETSGEAEHRQRNGERHVHLRLAGSELLTQRVEKHAPTVNSTECELHAESSRRDADARRNRARAQELAKACHECPPNDVASDR